MGLSGKPEDYIIPIGEVTEAITNYYKWLVKCGHKIDYMSAPHIIMNGEAYYIDFGDHRSNEVSNKGELDENL